ncbi:MAG: PAS domain S-box protein [Labilithrix sp.]|nr:PAS domain S-box protein [Labilithrix sp.]MCW5812671.1 PAS domain S-box protein [Labilithrix sp.]
MSWQAVALHFANQGQACALLDRDGYVRMFSTSFETLLGWQREDIEGRHWSEAIAPTAHAVVARSRIERALSGTLRSFDCEASTPQNARFVLKLQAALVGRNDEQGLLLTVSSAEPLEAHTLACEDEVDYEIASSVSDFGRLISLTTPRGPRLKVLPERCYAAIHGHGTPCNDCPALQHEATRWPRTAARWIGGPENIYEVVTAEAQDDRIRVRLRRISERTLNAIHESKLRSLADAAHLSERERAVLTYLLMGRSLADIATILGISIRTVKFHQANVLEKLGADSRADLVRLIT